MIKSPIPPSPPTMRGQVDQRLHDGATPLFISAQNGHLSIAQMLVSKDAEIDAQLNDGAGPLFVASQNGHAYVK